jgi:hypothetical protein
MLASDSNREQLRQYLSVLSSEKRAELLEKIERAILRGENVEDSDIILAELRSVIRNSPVTTERAGSPSRRFFDPIEPFIVEGVPTKVVRGEIARGSLNPIWIWISRDLLPKEAKSYSRSVARALGADDRKAVAAHVEAFHALSLPMIRKALASRESIDDVEDSLATYMGSSRAIADLGEVATVLAIRHPLKAVASKLPQRIGNFSGEELTTVKRALDEAMAECGDAFTYALLLVMKRLSEPWQLVRLETTSGHGATSPYRFTFILVIAHIEQKVSNLRTALTSGDTETIAKLVESISGTLAGLESEIDLSGNSWIAQKFNEVRNEVHTLLAGQIEATSSSIRRLFDLTTPMKALDDSPDAVTLAATERAVALLEIFRTFQGPLSLGAKITSALAQVRNVIERSVAVLLQQLRTGFDSVRSFCLTQINHAVRICTRLFGKKIASEIVAATETAVEKEQRAV